MQRILILGPPGAGKSTFARRLGEHLDYPVIHLDEQFWNPGWEMPTKEEWIDTQRALTKSSAVWIMDGNYDGTLEVRLPAADTVVLLQTTRWHSIYRVLKRWWTYRGEVRPDMAEGCTEKVDLAFLRYALTFHRDELPIIEGKIQRYGADVDVYRLDASAGALVDALEAQIHSPSHDD